MARTFPLAVVVSAVDRFSGPLARMGGAAGRFGRDLSKIGRNLTLTVSAPLAAVAAASIKAGTDFRKSLNQVQASTGATAEEMAGLRAQAEGLAGSTHTIQQVAEAQALLAREGEDVLAITQQTAPALRLQTAAQLELGEAVEFLNGTLDAYGLEAKDAARVTDLLAEAGRKTNLANLLEALQKVGPRARASSQSLPTIVALIDALADAGFDAAAGGTALDAVLKSLAKPSASAQRVLQGLKIRPEDLRDSEGNLLDLVDILELLQSRGADARHALVLFAKTGGPAMAALLAKGLAPIRAQAKALENVDGAAQRMSDTLNQGGVDATTKLADSMARLGIALAESGLIDALADLATFAGKVVHWFERLSPTTKRWIVTIGGVAAAVGPVLVTVGGLITTLSALGVKTAVFGRLAFGVAGKVVPLVAALAGTYKIASDLFDLANTIAGRDMEAATGGPKVDRPAMDAGAFPSGRPAGGPPRAPAGITGEPVGDRRLRALGAAAARQGATEVGGRLQVDFRNAPPGTRVRAQQEGPMALDVQTGVNMAGAL